MNKYDVIVVGGGIMGASLTYYLSLFGKRVLLVEKTDLDHGSAGATDGYITPHTKQPGYHLQLALESCKLYETLEEEIESDIDIELALHCGGLQVCEDQRQWELISDNREKLSAGGLELYMLETEEARKIEPAISPKMRGAMYSPIASGVNPFKLTQAFADKAKKLGAEIFIETKVESLVFDGPRVAGIRAAGFRGGTWYADYVADCCGSWGAQFAALAGVEVPIVPKRGQVIVSEPVAPLLNTVMQTGLYPIIKFKPELIEDERIFRLGLGFGMEQTRDGSILISGTRELAGFDRGNTLECIEAVIQTAAVYIPAITGLYFIRCFSGLRPHTPDGLPILGRVKQVPGFIMCCGHEGDGIALAPISGKLVAEEIVYGKTSFPIEACAAERFTER
ncbi:MAG: FAD-binding oxidoreductase [Treponema sp.]|jgi:sarcosine oxidase subunit beta|nr:FAD-binding oxidoreductase [Treponema sp.]